MKTTVRSHNRLKRLGSILEFLYEYVNLDYYDIQLVRRKRFALMQNIIIIRERKIIGKIVYELTWNRDFHDFIVLPSEVVKLKALELDL